MKTLLGFLVASLMAVGSLSAETAENEMTKPACQCENCPCTKDKNCGCASKSGCKCSSKDCKCRDKCQCGDSCSCGGKCRAE